MNICCSRLGGMFLTLVICCFSTTVLCQDQKWAGYHYQYNPSDKLWPIQSLDKQIAANHDLQVQSSIRRPSSYSSMGKILWQNPHSKPQWQTPMYKRKWQDPFSKPQWQVSKAQHLKPFTKQPFKNKNVLDKQWHDGGWNSQKQWQGKWRAKFPTPAPRYITPGTWPDYIPPLSIIKPSMDDPHALYNLGK